MDVQVKESQICKCKHNKAIIQCASKLKGDVSLNIES